MSVPINTEEQIEEEIQGIKDLSNDVVGFGKFLFKEETWITFGLHILKIVMILFLAAVVVWVGRLLIRRFFRLQNKTRLTPARRQKTIVKLLENVIMYVVYFSAMLAILSEYIDIRGLLAGAGILGLAIGFGAQSLVKDIISGFFIIFEDQFSVGDLVQIGAATGVALEIGLRTTKIQSVGGEIHVIPNGNIAEVINYSLDNSSAIIDISVAYESDLNKVEQLVESFLQELPDRYEELIEPPQLLGVESLAPSEIVLRVIAKTRPIEHWAFARKFRKEIKQYLDEQGVEIPYPRLVTYERKEGE